MRRTPRRPGGQRAKYVTQIKPNYPTFLQPSRAATLRTRTPRNALTAERERRSVPRKPARGAIGSRGGALRRPRPGPRREHCPRAAASNAQPGGWAGAARKWQSTNDRGRGDDRRGRGCPSPGPIGGSRGPTGSSSGIQKRHPTGAPEHPAGSQCCGARRGRRKACPRCRRLTPGAARACTQDVVTRRYPLRRSSCGVRVRVAPLDGADPLEDRLREPAAAGGRASVSEGSDAAGSDLGARLPVEAPHDSNEGVSGKDYGPITSNGGSGCIRKQGIWGHTFLGPCLRLLTALKFLILRPL